MGNFYDKLIAYIEKNSNKKAIKNFKFKDSILSYNIALEIYNLIVLNEELQEDLLKEKDYNRLLRIENDILTQEADKAYEILEEEGLLINSEKIEDEKILLS